MSFHVRWARRIGALAFLLASCTMAFAQAPLRIVVGGPPGGVFDIALRIVMERLQRDLGQIVVIENRPGAGGAVALAAVRNAKPDGLTAAMINVAAAANESIISNRGYDLFADFEPVGMYAHPSNILIVHPGIGADSVPALVRVLKSRTAPTPYSSGGVGSPGHLAGEMFRMRTGAPVAHVPYKGAPPAVLAVATGEVGFMFATASSALGQIQSGKVKALAVTTAERLPQLPELPTMAQAGLADFDVSDWMGVVLPRGVSAQVRDRLHGAFAAAFADPEAGERLRKATFIPAAPVLGPAEFGAFLRAEASKWAAVVRDARISPQ
jgi:tripartite-type tricarboxylate transporter receptor subunit TctC